MNALNIRTIHQLFVSPRPIIAVLALLVLGITIAGPVSANTNTVGYVDSTPRVSAKATASRAEQRSTTGLAQMSAKVPEKMSAKMSAKESAGNVSKVDLNTATAEQLASVLKGIGAAKAQAIVRYRSEVGPFRSIAELEEVKGIGPSIVALNKERIALSRAKY